MAKTNPPYAPEFRRQLVELVRAGRDPGDLAREFEPSAQAIRNWVVQADLQDGRREATPAADAGPITTQRDQQARPAPDLVDRDFQAAGPSQLWVADITPAFAHRR
jgi:transposase